MTFYVYYSDQSFVYELRFINTISVNMFQNKTMFKSLVVTGKAELTSPCGFQIFSMWVDLRSDNRPPEDS